MSLHGAGLDHRLYVLFAVVTHAALGYALVSVTTGRTPLAGAVAAVLPDVDLLFAPESPFPFVHRGLTHTPLVGAAVVGAIAWGALWRSESNPRHLGAAVALGYGSHLVVDSLTASGVPWLYPLSSTGYGVDLAVHATEHGLVIWATLAVGWLAHRRVAGGSVGS